MKLLTVLLLAALPLYCYAGAGCQVLEDVISAAIDPKVSEEEYLVKVGEFLHGDEDTNAVKQFKQCFLNQADETLANVEVMMETIYNSKYCEKF